VPCAIGLLVFFFLLVGWQLKRSPRPFTITFSKTLKGRRASRLALFVGSETCNAGNLPHNRGGHHERLFIALGAKQETRPLNLSDLDLSVFQESGKQRAVSVSGTLRAHTTPGQPSVRSCREQDSQLASSGPCRLCAICRKPPRR